MGSGVRLCPECVRAEVRGGGDDDGDDDDGAMRDEARTKATESASPGGRTRSTRTTRTAYS